LQNDTCKMGDQSIEFNPVNCNLLRVTNKKKKIEADYTIKENTKMC